MRVKPILFSSPMVRAIFHNKKSQTRRICKIKIYPSRTVKETWDFETKTKSGRNVDIFELNEALLDDANYKVGDVLWVRETWSQGSFENGSHTGIRFKADNENHSVKWKPSIFMPREAARIFLKVTKVRVERLQDITEKDAIAEGIEVIGFNDVLNCDVYKNYGNEKFDFLTAVKSFESLWVSINGEHSWNKNSFVWVYDFEVIDRPENF